MQPEVLDEPEHRVVLEAVRRVLAELRDVLPPSFTTGIAESATHGSVK